MGETTFGNDNRFIAVVAEIDTGEVMNSEKSGTDIFRFSFGLHLHNTSFELETRHYSGKDIFSQKDSVSANYSIFCKK